MEARRVGQTVYPSAIRSGFASGGAFEHGTSTSGARTRRAGDSGEQQRTAPDD